MSIPSGCGTGLRAAHANPMHIISDVPAQAVSNAVTIMLF